MATYGNCPGAWCHGLLSATETITMAHQQTRSLPLRGGNVLDGFVQALITESNRSGQSISEIIMRAAAERLAQRGVRFDGLFVPGDVQISNDSDTSHYGLARD
jgi:hypothetical protein